MKVSDERILTTHAGSLPRTTALTDLLIRREQGKPFDQAEFDREADRALDLAVGKQLVCGIDIGNDGEMPRIGFSTYVAERMSGFGGESRRNTPTDMIKFPDFAAFLGRQIGTSENLARVWNAPQALGAVRYDETLERRGGGVRRLRPLPRQAADRLRGCLHDGRLTRHRDDDAAPD